MSREVKENDMYVRVDTIIKDLQISKPLAYKLMKEMNDELREKGFMVISGRVPRAYYKERFYGLSK